MSDLQPEQILRSDLAEYKVLGLIGRGGMAAVYRVQRLADGSVWALKEMRPPPDATPTEIEENRQLFRQEGTLLRQLSHPNLIVVADQFEVQGRQTMVIEFVPGKTLEDLIYDANAPLLEQRALRYGIQLCRVLYYLHTRTPPIIYRDLKPSNVMVTPEEVLKLIDFGVARTYKAHKSKDTIAMGSAGYAPPEQYGKGQTDARSDVYALGATLLHLLTNLPPVPLQPPQRGSIRRINPSVSERTEELIIRSMALDQSRRFQIMTEFEQAMIRCLDAPYADPLQRATPPPPVNPPQRQPVAPVPAPAPYAPPAAQPAAPPQVAMPTWSTPPVQAPVAAAPVEAGAKCPNCGRMNKSRARFCAACGGPLGVMPVARLMITSPRGTWEHKIERIPCRIGRRDPRQNHYPEIDLAEHDRGIASRNHAIISRDGDYYSLTDLGSTNGTYVNGHMVTPRQAQRLRPGDRIKVGEVEMEFRWS